MVQRNPSEPLSACDSGVVLGAIVAGQQGDAILRRIAGERGERCLASYGAIMAQGRKLRQRTIQRLTKGLLSPLPEGLELIHPTWIARTLSQQPPALAAIVAQSLPAELRPARLNDAPAPKVTPRARLHLCAYVLRKLHVMPEATECTAADGSDLVLWPQARLEQLFDAVGCLVLADLGQQAGSSYRERLVSTLPRPYSSWIRRARGLLPQDGSALADWPPGILTSTLPDDETAAQQRTQHVLAAIGMSVAAAALAKSTALALAQRLTHDVGHRLCEAGTFGPNAELLFVLRSAATLQPI